MVRRSTLDHQFDGVASSFSGGANEESESSEHPAAGSSSETSSLLTKGSPPSAAKPATTRPYPGQSSHGMPAGGSVHLDVADSGVETDQHDDQEEVSTQQAAC